MQTVRHLFAQRHLAVLLCAAALLLKLLVPTGYMIESDHGRLAVVVCSGIAPATSMEMHDGVAEHGKSKDHGKADMPCAFSGFSAAMTTAIDPVQLAALIAFVMALGLMVATVPVPSRPAFLRPPLRGPPAYL